MPNCDTDDGNLGDAIVSNTTNGDTVVMCGPCLVAWGVALCEGAGLVVTNPNDDQADDGLTPADEQAETSAAAEIGELLAEQLDVIDPPPAVTSESARAWLEEQAARNVAAAKLEPSDSPAEGSTADSAEGGEVSDLVSTPAGELPDAPPF